MEYIDSLSANIGSWLNIFISILQPPLVTATASIILGAIIIWLFRRRYRKDKESAKEAELDLHLIKGNWPEETKQAARDRLSKRITKQFLTFGSWIIVSAILFLGFSKLFAYFTEVCHPFHVKVATRNAAKLPPPGA